MSLIMGSQPVRAVLVWDLLGLQNMQNNALLLRIVHMSREHPSSHFNIQFLLCFYSCTDAKEPNKWNIGQKNCVYPISHNAITALS